MATIYVNSAWAEMENGATVTVDKKTYTIGTDAFSNLDDVFAADLTGDVTVQLLSDVAAYNKVDTSYASSAPKYNFVTDLSNVTIDFQYSDNWNNFHKYSLGENIVLNCAYLYAIGGDIEIAGTVNTNYYYFYGTGAGVTIEKTGVLNADVAEDKTVQVKGGTILEVYGEINTGTLNVWTQDVNNSQLIVSGKDAVVNAAHIHAWNGKDGKSSQLVQVTDGGTINSGNMEADRGSIVELDGGNVNVEETFSFGYGDNVGTLTVNNKSSVEVGKLNISKNSSGTADSTSVVIAGECAGKFVVVEGLESKAAADAFAKKSSANFVANIGDKDYFYSQGAEISLSTIYVDSSLAGKNYGDEVDGKFFGINAFASLLDYTPSADSTTLNIAAGTYSSIYNTTTGVSVLKGGIKNVTATGDVTIDIGSLVFETDVEGEINISGNFKTADSADWDPELNGCPGYTGQIWFKGGDNTVFNLDGNFFSNEQIQFKSKTVISENSTIQLQADKDADANSDSASGALYIYADVTNYGKMIAKNTQHGNMVLVNYGAALTLSGEDALLDTQTLSKHESWASDVLVMNGSLVVEKGATVDAAGKITVQENGSVSVDGANFSAGSVANSGDFTATGDVFFNIGTLTGKLDCTDIDFADKSVIGGAGSFDSDDYVELSGKAVTIDGDVKINVRVEANTDIEVTDGSKLTGSWICLCDADKSLTVAKTATVECTDLWSSVTAPAYAKIEGVVTASHNVWLCNADIYGTLNVGNQLLTYSNDSFNVYGTLNINGDGSPVGWLIGHNTSAEGAYAGNITVNVAGGAVNITKKSITGEEIKIQTNGILNITKNEDGKRGVVDCATIITNAGKIVVDGGDLLSNYQIVNSGSLLLGDANVRVTYPSAKDGRGSITNKENAILTIGDATNLYVGTVTNNGTLNLSTTATVDMVTLAGSGNVVITLGKDFELGEGESFKVLDVTSSTFKGNITIDGAAGYIYNTEADGDIVITNSVLSVSTPEALQAALEGEMQGRDYIRLDGRFNVSDELAGLLKENTGKLIFAEGALLLWPDSEMPEGFAEENILPAPATPAVVEDNKLALSSEATGIVENVNTTGAFEITNDNSDTASEIRSDINVGDEGEGETLIAGDVNITNSGKELQLTGSITASGTVSITNDNNETGENEAVFNGGNESQGAKVEAETIKLTNAGHAVVDFTAKNMVIANNSMNTLTGTLTGEESIVVGAGSISADGEIVNDADADGSIANATLTAPSIELAGQQVSDSTLNGKVLITGDSSFAAGENTVAGTYLNVNNGAKLTVEAEAELTASGYIFAGDCAYFDELAGDKGGSIDIKGTVNAEQINANAGGVVTIEKGGELNINNTIAVENGELDGAKAGVFNVDAGGEANTKYLNIFNGGTANISGKVTMIDHETNQSQLNVYAGGTANIYGEVIVNESATVGADGTLNITGGSLTVDKTLTNNDTITITGGTLDVGTLTNSGTFRVTGTEASTVKAAITGNALQLDNGVLEDSEIGGTVNVYGTNNTIKGTADNPTTTGNIQIGFGNYTAANAALNILGNVTTDIVYVGLKPGEANDAYQYKLNIGSAGEVVARDEENRKTADVSISTLNIRPTGKAAIDNATITLRDDLFVRGELVINNSSVTGNETYHFVAISEDDFENTPRVQMNGSDFILNGGNTHFHLGSRGGDSATGNAELVLNDSKITAYNFAVAGGGDWDVSLTLTDNSVINGFGLMNIAAGADVSLTGSRLEAGTWNEEKTEFTGIELKMNGAISMDEESLITAGSITGTGVITIDAADFSGIKKVIDISDENQKWEVGSNIKFENLGKTQVAYGADGDVTLVNVDTKTLYVNSAWKDYENGQAIAGSDNKLAFGVNAFANSKDALTVANANGGATIDISGMGDAIQSEFALTSAGEYVVTGGNGSKFTPILVNGKDVKLKFDGAFVTLGKLRGGKDKVDNVDVYQKNSIEIVDSVIAQTTYAGYGGGWATFYDCSVTISNSIYGINLSKYDNALELPRSAEDIKAAIEKGEYTLASGHGYDGQHIGTVGFLDIDASTVFTGFFSVSDRGYADIDNSVIYLCGGMGIGDGTIKNGSDSNESGWGSTSAEDYRVGEVATMDVTDSIVRNLSLNGNGGGLQVGGDNKAGVLNITNSEVDFTVKADNCDKVAIYENGTINMTDSVFKAGSVTNNGTFSVGGESTLNIDNYNNGKFVWGKAIQLLDGAIIKDSNVGGYVDAVGKVTFRGDNTFGTIQDFEANYIDNNKAVNNTEMIIEKGASVTTTSQKFTIGFGDKLSVYGNLEDAKAAYEAGTLTADDYSLDAQKGMFFQGNRADDVTTFNVNDAYVRLGANGQNVANAKNEDQRLGTYNFNWTNAVVESEETFDFKDSGENNGNYNFNLDNTVLKVGAVETDNSYADAENNPAYRGAINFADKDSTFKAKDSKVVVIGKESNNYNAGTFEFDNSELNLNAALVNDGSATFDGENAELNATNVINRGTITLANGAELNAGSYSTVSAKVAFYDGSDEPENITFVAYDEAGKEIGRTTAFINGAAEVAVVKGDSYKAFKADGTQINDATFEIVADSSDADLVIDETAFVKVDTFYNGGSISVTNSTFVASTLINDGDFTVSGTSTINANLSGSKAVLIKDAELDGVLNVAWYELDKDNKVISHTGSVIVEGDTTLNGTINNIVQVSQGGFAPSGADESEYYSPYHYSGTAGKIVMGRDKAAKVTLNGVINGANVHLQQGVMTVTDGAGIYGTPENIPSWMNQNVGGYNFAVGVHESLYNTEDYNTAVKKGKNAIAELTLESGAELARFGMIWVGFDQHDKGDNAYILNVNEGAKVYDFNNLTIRGDGTINVAGTIESFTTKTWEGSSASGANWSETANNGGYNNNNGIMNVSSTGKVKINGMNIGRKPEYGTAELNIDGGTVEFGRYGMNVGYAGSREGMLKLTNGGTLKSVDHTIDKYTNLGTPESVGTTTVEVEAKPLSVGEGAKGTIEVLSGSTVDVSAANIGNLGTVTVDGSTFSADSLTNKGTFTLNGGTVNASTLTNSGAFTIAANGVYNQTEGNFRMVTGATFTVAANGAYNQTGGNFWLQGGDMVVQGYAEGKQLGNAYTYGSITVDGTYAAKGNNGKFIVDKLSIYPNGSLNVVKGGYFESKGALSTMSGAAITVDNSTFIAKSVSNSGSFIVKGASTLEIGGFSGSEAIKVADGAKLSGNIGSIEEGTGKVYGVNLNLDGTAALTDKANFIGEIQGNNLSIGKNYSGSLQVTTKGDAALVIAAGAVLDSNDDISGNVKLLGNITVNNAGFEAAVTGNKNITVSSGILNLKAGSQVNMVTIGGESRNGVTIAGTVQNVTIKGNFNTLILNNGAELKTITIDGNVEHKSLFAGLSVLDSFGTAAVSGKNNAVLTVASAVFKGNTVKGVKLNLTNVGFDNDVDVAADVALSDIKSINENAVKSVNGVYFYTAADEKTYILNKVDGGIDIVEAGSDSGDADVFEEEMGNFTLTGDLALFDVTMKSGNTTLKVANGDSASIGTVEKSINGGVNNVTVGNDSGLTVYDIERMGNITVGKNGSEMTVKDELTGTSAAETITIGDNSDFESKGIDFAAGKATFKLGKNADATVDGNFTVDGANNTITLAADAGMNITGNIINNCGDNYDAVNGTVKYATTFGTTINLGKGAVMLVGQVDDATDTVTTTDVIGLAGLTLASGSAAKFDRNGNEIAEEVNTIFAAGNVYGTEKNNTINVGNFGIFTANSINMFAGNDTIKVGNDSEFVVATFDQLGNKDHADIVNVETISIGARSGFAAEDIIGVNKLTAANGSYDKKADEITYTVLGTEGFIEGTVKNDTISLGNWNHAVINGIDLLDGNDTLKLGSDSVLLVGKDPQGVGNLDTADIANVETISIGARSQVAAKAITGVNKLTAANGVAGDPTQILATGTVTGTAKNDTISLGNWNAAQVGEIDLADGNDTLKIGNDSLLAVADLAALSYADIKNVETISIGARSTFAAKAITGVNKLTAANGSYDKKTDVTSWTKVIAGVVTGTEKNNTVTFGNYNDVKLDGINLDAGNDTLKIGNDSIVDLGAVDLGAGNDTLTIGKNSVVTFESITGLETLNATKGAEIWFNNDAADVDLTGVKGSWKNATIFDDMGEINANGTFGGHVYANEWDVFEVGAIIDNIQVSDDVTEVWYSIDGGISWNEYPWKTGVADDIDLIKVGVDFSDKDQYAKKDYSITVTLA